MNLKNYLKQEFRFNDVYRKIKIETIWNQFIYNKFSEKLIINENEIKNKFYKIKKILRNCFYMK